MESRSTVRKASPIANTDYFSFFLRVEQNGKKQWIVNVDIYKKVTVKNKFTLYCRESIVQIKFTKKTLYTFVHTEVNVDFNY